MANSKRKYIEAAYQVLQEQGIDKVSIRRVAEQVGVTSAALYKHFKDVDELIAVASIRYLHDYAEDARLLSKVDMNPLELNLQLWECLSFYSFRDAPIFSNLFFGPKSTEVYSKVATEYYDAFPEDIENLKGFMQEMFEGSNILERDSILLKKAADKGMLTEESARYLAQLDTFVFRGMLSSVYDTYQSPGVARKATHDFMRILLTSYRSQLNPGYTILSVSPDKPSLNLDRQMENSHFYQVIIPLPVKGKVCQKASSG